MALVQEITNHTKQQVDDLSHVLVNALTPVSALQDKVKNLDNNIAKVDKHMQTLDDKITHVIQALKQIQT